MILEDQQEGAGKDDEDRHPADAPDTTRELRAALEQLSFPTIGHFLEESFLDPGIHAMVTPNKIVGRAITVRVTAPDAVLVHKATELR